MIWSYMSVLSQSGGVQRHSMRSSIGLPEAKVEVRDAPGKGMGVFALEPIEVGSWVCRYVGKLIEWEEYVQLSQKDASLLDYIFKIVDPATDEGEGAVFLDARESRHFSRYFNHAEDGNLEFEIYPEERRVEFFASRSIAVGDELNFDYGFTARATGQVNGPSQAPTHVRADREESSTIVVAHFGTTRPAR